MFTFVNFFVSTGLITLRIITISFYRTSPGRASVIALLLECVDFALSVYFTFVRMVKLVIVAALFVGRVDTPVLAKGN